MTGNLTLPGLNFSTLKTQYIMISSADLNTVTCNDWSFAHDNGYAYSMGPGPNERLISGINIPNGATITKIVFYYNDTDAAEKTAAELRRENVLNTSQSETIAQLTSTGSA